MAGITTTLRLQDKFTKQIANVTRGVNQALQTMKRLDTAVQKTETQLEKMNKVKFDNANRGMRNLNRNVQNTSSSVDSLTGKFTGLIATIAGAMGTRALFNLSDDIASAMNMMDYSARQINPDLSEEQIGVLTEQNMQKITAASNRARTDSVNMLQNVGKTMALAGNAFGNNVDNAIRFQEIMAKSYAIGGASAEEQASSMYQMVQALGSGILQGDELRSVREGAPLAYQAIEQFAQGVYDSTESLKEMASEGKITADIVTNAILQSGEAVDEAFGKTRRTWAQIGTIIKNSAVETFRPFLQGLNEIANSDAVTKIVSNMQNTFKKIQPVLQSVLNGIQAIVDYVADNWWIVENALKVTIALLTTLAFVSIANVLSKLGQFALAHPVITALSVAIGVAITKSDSLAEALDNVRIALAGVAIVVGIIGLIINIATMNVVGIIGFAVLTVVGFILLFYKQFAGIAYAVVAMNELTWMKMKLAAVDAIMDILEYFIKNIQRMVLTLKYLKDQCAVVVDIIKLAFEKGFNAIELAIANVELSFWKFIKSCLDGTSKLLQGLKPLMDALGINFSVTTIDANVNGAQDKVNTLKETKSGYQEEMDALIGQLDTNTSDFIKDWNELDLQWDKYRKDAYAEVTGLDAETAEKVANMGIGDVLTYVKTAYDMGYNKADEWGKSIIDKINNGIDEFTENLKNPFDPNILNTTPVDNSNLKDIADDTKSIKKNTEKQETDLSYLRDLAERETINRFTTAEIRVDLGGITNMVNERSDLDGIVTYLRDTIEEEMNAVANGAY